MNENSNPGTDAIGLHTLQVISKARRFNSWMYDEIRPLLKGEVLEIGSGIGNISQLAVDDGYSITLSDYDSVYCELLKKKFSACKNVKAVLQIDLLHSGFEDRYRNLKAGFDSIFLLNVIEHLEDDAAALHNCNYLLKPSGHLIVLTPAYNWLYCKLDKELGHYKRYRLKEIQKFFLQESLTLLEGHYFNFAGITGWLLFGKIFKQKSLGTEMSVFNALVPAARLADKLVLKKIGLSVIVAGIKNKS